MSYEIDNNFHRHNGRNRVSVFFKGTTQTQEIKPESGELVVKTPHILIVYLTCCSAGGK